MSRGEWIIQLAKIVLGIIALVGFVMMIRILIDIKLELFYLCIQKI